jgi:hypothetical protein
VHAAIWGATSVNVEAGLSPSRHGVVGARPGSAGARSAARQDGAALGPITSRFSGPGLPLVAPAAERARYAHSERAPR